MAQSASAVKATREFLRALEGRTSHKPPAVPSESPVRKSVADFARFASQPNAARAPASAKYDPNDCIAAYRGSVYIAVGAIARRIAMQDVKVEYRRQKKSGIAREPAPADHPLRKLFEHVNDFHVEFDLWFHIVGWKLLCGDAYLWKVRNGLGAPAELWPLPSQWTRPIPSATQFIGSYLVRGVFGADKEIPAADVIHFREPGIDWFGTSRFHGHPVLAAMPEMVDAERAMHARVRFQMENYAPTGLHYSTVEELSEQQLFETYGQILAQHSAAEHTGRPIVTHSGFKATDPGSGRNELDYRASLDLALEFILATFGVPKAVVGLVKDLSRANAIGGLIAFAENTVNPQLVMLGQQLTQNLAHDFDRRLCVRFDPICAEEADRIRRDIESATRAGAVTVNEVREHMLKLPAYKSGGDRPLIPAGYREGPIGNEDISDEERRPDPAAQGQGSGGKLGADHSRGDGEVGRALASARQSKRADFLPFRTAQLSRKNVGG